MLLAKPVLSSKVALLQSYSHRHGSLRSAPTCPLFCPPLLPSPVLSFPHVAPWSGWNTLLFPSILSLFSWSHWFLPHSFISPATTCIPHTKKCPPTLSGHDLNQYVQGCQLRNHVLNNTIIVTQLSSRISLTVFLSTLLIISVLRGWRVILKNMSSASVGPGSNPVSLSMLMGVVYINPVSLLPFWKIVVISHKAFKSILVLSTA